MKTILNQAYLKLTKQGGNSKEMVYYLCVAILLTLLLSAWGLGSFGRAGLTNHQRNRFTEKRTSCTACLFGNHALISLEVEKPALKPLPAERFSFFKVGTRLVHPDGYVEVDWAYYAVPDGLLGEEVRVHIGMRPW